MPASFEFKVISSSWVALHPEPDGVVQFIGGAFFGTLPNFSSPLMGWSLFDLSPIVSYHFEFIHPGIEPHSSLMTVSPDFRPGE